MQTFEFRLHLNDAWNQIFKRVVIINTNDVAICTDSCVETTFPPTSEFLEMRLKQWSSVKINFLAQQSEAANLKAVK